MAQLGQMSIITVTTTTVVTTAIIGMAATLGVGGTLILICALVSKELTSSPEEQKPALAQRLRALSSSLNFCIMPLLFIFALIVITKVIEILSGH